VQVLACTRYFKLKLVEEINDVVLKLILRVLLCLFTKLLLFIMKKEKALDRVLNKEKKLNAFDMVILSSNAIHINYSFRK